MNVNERGTNDSSSPTTYFAFGFAKKVQNPPLRIIYYILILCKNARDFLRIFLCIFCMIGADANAFAAVNTAFRNNICLAAAHANGARRATLNAVNAAFAFFFVQSHGMEKFI